VPLPAKSNTKELLKKVEMKLLLIFSVVCWLFACVESDKSSSEDKLSLFYKRLSEPDVKYCSDKTKLLPNCNECIPGMQQSAGSQSCDQFAPASRAIRDEIRQLVIQRFGLDTSPDRKYGLYPCKLFFCLFFFLFDLYFLDLEKKDFLYRQVTFGRMISERKVKNIIDIGAYYNPINLFLSSTSCPESIIIIEPILDALSAMVPCSGENSERSTHIIVLPITFKNYITIKQKLPPPETVVCIGCDSHYGPNRKMLETSFLRPFSLFLEYPSEYLPNGPFKKMMGTTDDREKMTFIHKFQVSTNETIYTKRVMKVIEYS
jgi:hypothetical protein